MKGKKKRRKMPFKRMWKKELTKDLGEEQAEELMTRVQEKYNELCANHKKISRRVLRKHLYGNIFPQMAAYKTFLENNHSPESAFDLIQKLHFLTLNRLRTQYRYATRVPWIFLHLRIVGPITIKLKHPPEGWNIEWIENSRDCINLKAHSCFYHDIITEYGVPDLTLIYCNGDDYVFDIKSPYVKWGRTTTVTRGGDYCDIVYHRISKKNRKDRKKQEE